MATWSSGDVVALTVLWVHTVWPLCLQVLSSHWHYDSPLGPHSYGHIVSRCCHHTDSPLGPHSYGHFVSRCCHHIDSPLGPHSYGHFVSRCCHHIDSPLGPHSCSWGAVQLLVMSGCLCAFRVDAAWDDGWWLSFMSGCLCAFRVDAVHQCMQWQWTYKRIVSVRFWVSNVNSKTIHIIYIWSIENSMQKLVYSQCQMHTVHALSLIHIWRCRRR